MQNIILLVVFAFSYVTSDRVYTSECPVVVPMPDFNMKKVRYIFVFQVLLLF